MVESKQKVIEDFDRIANLKKKKWDHNSHYLSYLLRYVPNNCSSALDVGCGTGEFARLLAERSNSVLAIDLSPMMIERAEKESTCFRNIHYELKDFLEYKFKPEQFDCIVSVATIHHLPMNVFLHKVKQALKPGGVLLVLDLYKSSSISDFLISAIAAPINIIFMLVSSGRVRVSEEERLAWAEHLKNDRYLTIKEIKAFTNSIIPRSIIRRHLFWRYSIVWKKPVRCTSLGGAIHQITEESRN